MKIIQGKFNFKAKSPSWSKLGSYSMVTVGNTSIKAEKRGRQNNWSQTLQHHSPADFNL